MMKKFCNEAQDHGNVLEFLKEDDICPICMETFDREANIFVCHTYHRYHSDCIRNFVDFELAQMNWHSSRFYPSFKCPLSNISYSCSEIAHISQRVSLLENGNLIKYEDSGLQKFSVIFRVYNNELNGLYKRRWTIDDENDIVIEKVFSGPMYKERKVRMTQYKRGLLCYEVLFFGSRGREFQAILNVYDENEDLKSKQMFEGEKLAERLVYIEYLGSNPYTVYFEGEKGMERKVRSEHFGYTVYFEESNSFERKIRVEMYEPKRQTRFFEGLKGHERLVKIVDHLNCRTSFFEGPRNEERIIKCAYKDRIKYYEGKAYEEQLVHTEFFSSEH